MDNLYSHSRTRQAAQLQDSLQLLTAKEAQVVVVTPETQANIGKAVEKAKARFFIVHDQSFTIMTAYHAAFTVDPATAQQYQGFGVDLQKANGSTDDMLPVPATYVIGRDGRSKFTSFNPDFKARVSMRRVTAAL